MKKTHKFIWIAWIVAWATLFSMQKNPNEKIKDIENSQKQIKKSVCQAIDCKKNTKNNILKNIENLENNIKNKKILENLDLIKFEILKSKNLDENDLDFYKNSVIELWKLDKVYDIFLEESLTINTNQQISKNINEVSENILNKKDFSHISEEILEEIKKDLELLKDNYFFQEKTNRDFIEKNIKIKKSLYWTYFENAQIEEFLNLFTIEYINLFWKEAFKNKKDLDLEKEKIEKIISKIISRKPETIFDFEVEFYSNWEKITINLEKFNKIIEIPKDGIIYSKDEKIAKIQEKYGLEHRTKSEFWENNEVIYSVQKNRVDKFLNSKKSLIENFYTDKEALEAEKKWLLVDAKKFGKAYFSLDKSLESHPTKTFATKDTLVIANNISKKFFEQTGKKLTINSLLRTKEINEKLSNSSKNSSHMNGTAIDFKIINLSYEEKNILKNILLDYDIKWIWILIEEKKPPHFHFSVLNLNNNIKIIHDDFDKLQDFDKNISITDYLDKNWLNTSTKIILEDIFKKSQIDYQKFSEKQKEEIIHNFSVFIKYIVAIESSWWNYLNNNKSSAKWPFQVLDWYINWKKHPNYKENFTTFETWLRNYIKYANNTDLPEKNDDLHPEWVEKTLKSKWKIWPNDLNQEQSINLFLVWTFLWDNKEKAEKFVKVLLNWDKEAMEELYKSHHSNPDIETKILMAHKLNIFWPKLKKVKL